MLLIANSIAGYYSLMVIVSLSWVELVMKQKTLVIVASYFSLVA